MAIASVIAPSAWVAVGLKSRLKATAVATKLPYGDWAGVSTFATAISPQPYHAEAQRH